MKRLILWIRTGLKERKVKVFLIFLLCATLAWLINKLSQTYTINTKFNITYVNVPPEYILANIPKKELRVRIKAVGFQLLGYGLQSKQIKLDVSKVMKKDSVFYLSEDQIRIQLETELDNSNALVDFDKDIIYFEFSSLETKKVPVQVKSALTFANNYILEGELKISPDSIILSGPKSQLDSISDIKTQLLTLSDLSANFNRQVALELPEELNITKFSKREVNVTGEVVKFSEQVMEIPVTVINVPENTVVRTFPEIVEVRCQGTLKSLKDLEAGDFSVVADYAKVSKETGNRLPISLVDVPKTLNNAFLGTNEIEFILRRE
ncbi:MAG: CdaR family protein [Maribacter sp.]